MLFCPKIKIPLRIMARLVVPIKNELKTLILVQFIDKKRPLVIVDLKNINLEYFRVIFGIF